MVVQLKLNFNSCKVISVIPGLLGRGLFLSLFGEIHKRQGGDYYSFQKMHVWHEVVVISWPKIDEGAGTDHIYCFCWSS